jgi:hypothetical protein
LPEVGYEVFIFTTPRVVAHNIFYDNSAWDGNDPTAGASDDVAIASDKTALLPGQTAGFANYTSFSKGINGIIVDVSDLPVGDGLSAADFTFRVGNDNVPGAWAVAPAPTSVTVRRNAGADGADRITLIWPDGAIQKTWLEVTVLPTANTGLAAADVFYFGNAVGETGNSTSNAVVNSFDEGLVRLNGRNALNPAPIDFRFDFNRDRLVNSADQVLARLNATSALSALRLIAPAAGATASQSATGVASYSSAEPLDSALVDTALADLSDAAAGGGQGPSAIPAARSRARRRGA